VPYELGEIKEHLPEEYAPLIPKMKEAYGSYSREEVLDKVLKEGWQLYEAKDGSTGARTEQGWIAAGSTAPMSNSLTYKQALIDFRANIVDHAMRDNALMRFYDGLMIGVDKADPRALQVFRDIFLGRAADLPADTATFYEQRALEDELRRMTEVRYEDGTSGPPDKDWRPFRT
jgi:hypothetical protein